NPTRAEIYFRNAIGVSDPRRADGHVGLGRALARQGRRDEALRTFREAAGRDPRYVPAQVELGKELHRRGNYRDAEAAFAWAPLEPEAWYLRGDCLERLADPDNPADRRRAQALACYREAFRMGYRDRAFLR